MHRASAVNSEETDNDYFKRSIWLPYLDAVIMHMTDKFSRSSQTAILLSSLLTGKEIEKENFQKVYAMYGKFIGCHEQQLHTELLNYQDYRFLTASSEDQADNEDTASNDDEDSTEGVSSGKTSQSMLDALSTAPGRFPNVRKLLRIAVTMPLTSCSAERCFSAMKILKSRLRSTMRAVEQVGINVYPQRQRHFAGTCYQQLCTEQKKTGFCVVKFLLEVSSNSITVSVL
jgi:hAT family C-terminal dimerisation region